MVKVHRMKLQASSWLAVVRAYNECNRRYTQLLAGFDLTIPQFDVLSAILNLDREATPKRIAAELVVTRGNITGVLRRLQERRLVKTRGHEKDGRSFVCELTAAGRRLLKRARAAASTFITRQLSPFDDDTLQRTEKLMNHMHEHLRSIDPQEILEACR